MNERTNERMNRIRTWSCDTTTTAPSNRCTHSAKAATLSRSRLLVGSSITIRWGRTKLTAAMATRDLCPPLNADVGVICRHEEGGRMKEEGGRRKEEGGREKEEERYKPILVMV